jgi:hypothetical protein
MNPNMAQKEKKHVVKINILFNIVVLEVFFFCRFFIERYLHTMLRTNFKNQCHYMFKYTPIILTPTEFTLGSLEDCMSLL